MDNKKEKYEEMLLQAQGLTESENDRIANMANLSSLIKYTTGAFWVGFYRVSEDHLILGPYQGPLACTRIPFGKGVCGAAWEKEKTIIVKDVRLFPGHIACNSLSRSEIVIPGFCQNKVDFVLDLDSTETEAFDETDRFFLEKIAALLSE